MTGRNLVNLFLADHPEHIPAVEVVELGDGEVEWMGDVEAATALVQLLADAGHTSRARAERVRKRLAEMRQ